MEQEKKKRGRKPKGGKIIKVEMKEVKKEEITHAIILHLKCGITKNNENNDNISGMNEENYHYLKSNNTNEIKENNKNIYDKIKEINVNFKNNMTNTTSCCFWDTEKFNTSPIFIPSNITKNGIDVYGHFCSPQCATAYLFNEKIDTSIKWERYSYINNIYNKDYKHKISPAPSPHYVLKKYYGDLSIEEYRRLINYNELIIIKKPVTKITPELHINNKKINNI